MSEATTKLNEETQLEQFNKFNAKRNELFTELGRLEYERQIIESHLIAVQEKHTECAKNIQALEYDYESNIKK